MNFTLCEWVHHWLEMYKRITVKPSTYDSYLNYSTHVTCDKLLTDLTVDDIQKMVNDMVSCGCALSTIKHMLVVVRQSLKKAYKLRMIDNLSCLDGLELPRAHATRIDGLEDEYINLILENCHKTYYGDLYRCLLYTGMRVGEMIALRWCDVNFFTGYVCIVHTNYNRKLIGVKTDHSCRSIPLFGEFREILEKKYKSNNFKSSDFVFTNTKGNPILYHSLLSSWHDFLKCIGCNTFGLHVLRHSFAHHAIRRGVPIKVVSAWLGHSSINITLQIYDHVDRHDFKNAADTISGMYSYGQYENKLKTCTV